MNTTGTRAALLANASLAIALLLGAGQAAAVEFRLCAKPGNVTMPGPATVPIWGYVLDNDNDLSNGCLGSPALPGPALTVPAGDTTLTVRLRNELPEPTSIVIPGQVAAMTPTWNVGPPGARTSLAQRVRSFTHEAPVTGVETIYTWTSIKPGSYLYHSGTHPQVQVQMGLYGAVVKNAVEAVLAPSSPAQAYAGVPYDAQVTLVFSEIDPAQHTAIADNSFGTGSAPDTPCPDTGGAKLPMTSTLCYKPKYFLINGKPFISGSPALSTYTLQTGQRTLLRFLNAGLQSYAPVLQGMHMKMIAEDGNRYVYRDGTATLPRDQYQYSTLLPALKTVDAVITPTQAGRYPIYDRRLNVVNAASHNGGMFAYLDAVGADLTITKDDGVTSVAPGAAVTYTITVTNTGSTPVNGATVADTMPSALTNVTWTCSATAGGSSCAAASGNGNINHQVTLAASGVATFTVNATVAAGATGSLVNTATVTTTAGVADSATDTDEITAQVQANLGITKTNTTAVVAGQPVTYSIVVNNAGPSAATNATVTDNLPATLAGATWTCVAAAAPAGSACGAASGSGNIGTTVTLASGGSATYAVTATLSAAATGNLVNTATITAPPTVTDPIGANNTATDTDAITRQADLRIETNTGATSFSGGDGVVADRPLTYTIVARNLGPIAVTGARVTDTMPGDMLGETWTCVASAGSACGSSAPVFGNINRTVNLLVNGTATFTVNGRVRASATLPLVNTATVTAPAGVTDPNPANNSMTDTDAVTSATADLAITKTDGVTSVAAGGTMTYTIVASNAGPTAVTNAIVTDTMPAALTGAAWSCVASAGSSCGLPAVGNVGNISRAVNLLVGGSATFTVGATVAAGATGSVVNTASVATPAGVSDPNTANNSATDTNTITTAGPTQANLGITTTDGVPSVFTSETTTYTIVVSNAGASAVSGALVNNAVPANVSSMSWTCTPVGASSCLTPTTGTGAIVNKAVNLAGGGGSVTFTVNATVAAAATGSVVNTATVATPAGVTDPTPANNSASDTDTIAAIPVPTSRDNFNRATAANLGANWSQATTVGLGVFDVTAGNTATGIAIANQAGQAIWNVPAFPAGFGATQAAGYTYAATASTAARNNSALILKATGGTAAAPQNFVRVLYLQGATGQVQVQTTINGNAATPTWMPHGIPLNNANSSLVSGNRLNAEVDSTGRVRVWKSVGTTSVYIGKVQLPANPLWTTGGGRIGMKFEAGGATIGTRVDDFRGN